MSNKPPKFPLQWTLSVVAVGVVRKGVPSDSIGLFVSCTQTPEGWSVVAGESEAKDLEGVLASHSHKNLGTFPKLDHAMDIGQTYARTWLQSKDRDPSCECGEIK